MVRDFMTLKRAKLNDITQLEGYQFFDSILRGETPIVSKKGRGSSNFYFLRGPSYPPSRASLFEFCDVGATILVEWFSPGHYLNLMLQTMTGYQP